MIVSVYFSPQYGEIEEMNVCDNLGDHLVGNVYIKYRREEDAEKACKVLNTRWYDGTSVYTHYCHRFSDATDQNAGWSDTMSSSFQIISHCPSVFTCLNLSLYAYQYLPKDNYNSIFIRPGNICRAFSCDRLQGSLLQTV